MPSIIQMVRYDKFFSKEESPDRAKLLQIVDEKNGFKIESWGDEEAILWLNDHDEWEPLLFLNGFQINSRPLIETGSYYILAQLAEEVNCCLWLEEFGLAFIPGYGFLFDEEDGIYIENIHSEDLNRELKKTNMNLQKAIENLGN